MAEQTPFLAVDGEACEGDYVLLARTDSHPLTDLRPGGLQTVACLEYLLQAPKPSLQVCFGLGYDVNNWLRDLPRPVLEQLWATHLCYWHDYRIGWVPGRWFEVKDTRGRYARVTEIFGFFQSSFVNTLEAWQIGAPEMIRRMKGQRGDFKRAEIDAVRRYCVEELAYTVELMNRLREAASEAHVTPRDWIGAGSLAASLLRARNVKAHHRYDEKICSEHVRGEAVMGAYFAGRIELLRQGFFPEAKSADLKSAYPAAAADLPSLRGGRLRKRKRFNPNRPGIWKVKWDLRRGMGRAAAGQQAGLAGGKGEQITLAPFPVRVKQSIFYPLAGEGFYHAVEVAAALELGYPLEIPYGYVLEGPGVDERPFDFIPEIFAARARFAREGRAAEKVIKLGLNSVYGKLAQGYGFNNVPSFQSYFWAGQITAQTRAAVLKMASSCTNPIMIATDGIYAEKLGPTGRGKGLGSWERGQVDELFAAQPGVYEGVIYGHEMAGARCKRCRLENPPDDRCAVAKSRGFFASEVDYREVREGFELEGADYVHHYVSRRFNGLGSSLQRKDFSIWRKWTETKRSLLLWPERKIAGPDGVLLPFPGSLKSEPYKPKVQRIDERAIDQLMGEEQPMVIEI